MLCGFRFSFKRGHLIQIQITKTDKYGTAKEWLGPINRGDHLVQVQNFKAKFGTMKTGHLKEGGCLIQGQHIHVYTRLTVQHWLQ